MFRSLLALAGAFPFVIASPACSATPWLGGVYGPNNQTIVSGQFPISPGQSVSVHVVELATCGLPTTALLVQFSAFIMDVLSYEAVAPTKFSAGASLLVVAPEHIPDNDGGVDDGDEPEEETDDPETDEPGTDGSDVPGTGPVRRAVDREDPGDHLMGNIMANFNGASFAEYQNVKARTGFIWVVI